MAEVTLTSSMRANLYSLQQTAQMMGTVQQRLATGKKVNNALDNPNNYFQAQALSNRAADISSLLDGMGQAIQTIKAAAQGIESATKIVDQMKAVANAAAQGLTTASSASSTNINFQVQLGTQATTGAALDATKAYQYALTNLVGNGGTTSRNIKNGDQLTLQVGSGATYTFTVGASAANNGVVGNGGGTTAKDLGTWLTTVTGGSVASYAGAVKLAATAAGVTISGTLATALGITANASTATVTGASVDTIAYTSQAAATGSTLLKNLTDNTGKILSQSGGTTGGTGAGNYVSISVSGGTTKTINFTSSTTVQDVIDQVNTISGLTATIDAQGILKVVNNNSTAVTIGGTGSGLFGATSVAANGSITKTIVEGYGNAAASYYTANSNVPTLTNLQPPDGVSRIATGDQLKVTVDGVTTTITLNSTATTAFGAQTATTVSNVNGLLNALGQIDGITATLDTTTGQLDVRASGGKTITFSGNAAAKLNLPSTVAAGQSSLSGSGVSSVYIKQYDELRSQLDQLVGDASYKGTNLISSTSNNPLVVTFNEVASNANKLIVGAVDLTTKGLDLGAATGNWKDTTTIQESLTALTNAATTLREQNSTFGQNLTTVQTRQDFATNMIATLKEGSDKLTLADMNEEGANMLALQTRSQLGTQSLSLASQANQAVMRLFG